MIFFKYIGLLGAGEARQGAYNQRKASGGQRDFIPLESHISGPGAVYGPRTAGITRSAA